jgi:hypothetical protein
MSYLDDPQLFPKRLEKPLFFEPIEDFPTDPEARAALRRKTPVLAFEALKEYLRASGALERQVCAWHLTAERLAQARYRCGCWIAWEHPTDRCRDLVGPFPPPSADLDEFDFAEAHLGPLVCERACRRHGGKGEIDYSVDGYGKALHELTDGLSWWTQARCKAHGGHKREWKGITAELPFCARCDFDGKAMDTPELDAIELAISEDAMTFEVSS